VCRVSCLPAGRRVTGFQVMMSTLGNVAGTGIVVSRSLLRNPAQTSGVAAAAHNPLASRPASIGDVSGPGVEPPDCFAPPHTDPLEELFPRLCKHRRANS